MLVAYIQKEMFRVNPVLLKSYIIKWKCINLEVVVIMGKYNGDHSSCFRVVLMMR